MKVEEYLELESRFTMLARSKPETSKQLFAEAQQDADARWQLYQRLAAGNLKTEKKESP
jgi:pyruvate-ferredoxin/flavodoxin oxidoreductase